MRKQIIINILSNYAGRAVALVLGIYLVPFLIGKLGIEAFGVIVLAESLSRFIEMVSSSIRMALARNATFTLARNDMEEFTEYLSTGRVILFAAALAVFCLGVGFSFFVPHLFRIPAEHVNDSRALFLLFTLAFTITFPNMVFWSSLYAKQRYDLLNSATAAGLILRAVLVWILFSVLPARFINLTTYGVIYLTIVWADNFLVYIWSRRIFPDIRIRWSKFKSQKVREIFWFGAFMSISLSASVLYENIIQVVINVLWGPAYNAIYGIASKFPAAMKRLFLEPAWALTPTFTDLAARNEKSKMKLLFFMYAKVVLIASLPVTLFLIVMAGPIVEVWVGPDFNLAATLMSVMMLPLIVQIPFAVCGCMNNAYSKVKVPSLVGVGVLSAQLGLGVVLAKYFSMGLLGIAAAEAGMALTVSCLFSIVYTSRIAGLSLREIWLKVYLPPFLWGIFMTAAGIGVYRALDPGILRLDLPIALTLLIWAALYAAGAYRWTLSIEEKEQFKSLVRSMMGKMGMLPTEIPTE